MRSFFYVLTALAIIGLAFWSYQENYKTRASLKDGVAACKTRSAKPVKSWRYCGRNGPI